MYLAHRYADNYQTATADMYRNIIQGVQSMRVGREGNGGGKRLVGEAGKLVRNNLRVSVSVGKEGELARRVVKKKGRGRRVRGNTLLGVFIYAKPACPFSLFRLL